MEIKQLLNKQETIPNRRKQQNARSYLNKIFKERQHPNWKEEREKIVTKYLNAEPRTRKYKKKLQHLNWKERRRERTLKLKIKRRKITKEEKQEYDDLHFAEVLEKGQVVPQIRKMEDGTWETLSENL